MKAIKVRRSRRWRAPRALGFSAPLLLALGCDDEARRDGAASASAQVEPDLCGLALDSQPDRGACEPALWAAREPPDEAAPRSRSALEAQVETLLSFHCGECHGRCEQSEGGLSRVDDVDGLLATGFLVAGDPAGSPLLARQLEEPESPGRPRGAVLRHDPAGLACEDPLAAPPWLTRGEVALVEQLVEALPTTSAPGCVPSPRSLEEDHARLALDIAAQPAADRPYLRYLSLSHRLAAGDCDAELDVWRWAASKVLNALSLRDRVTPPAPVDEARTLYRLDLRNYGWDRAVVVDSTSHADWWDALAALSPYGVAWSGPQARALGEATTVSVPWLRVDALIDAAMAADVYAALLDIPESRQQLLFDLDVDGELGERAGFTAWDGERLVDRLPLGVRLGAIWQLFELGASADGAGLYDDVLRLDFPGPVEVMFQLPNRFFAFAEYGPDGRRLARAPVRTDPVSGGGRVRAGLACLSCHGRGPLPVVDEVRQVALDELSQLAGILSTAARERDLVEDHYLRFAEYLRVMENDGLEQQLSLGQAGIPSRVTDPITDLHRRFSAELGVEELAAELRVSEAALQEAAERLPEPLQGVVRSSVQSVPRDVVSAAYRDALCALHATSTQPPLHCTGAL